VIIRQIRRGDAEAVLVRDVEDGLQNAVRVYVAVGAARDPVEAPYFLFGGWTASVTVRMHPDARVLRLMVHRKRIRQISVGQQGQLRARRRAEDRENWHLEESNGDCYPENTEA